MREFPWMRRLLDDDPENAGGDGKPAGDPAQGKPEGKPAEETVSKADFKKLQDDLAAAKKRGDDAETAAQYWHQQVETASKGKKAAKGDDDEEPDVEAFLEDINKRGPKAIDDYLKKRNLVSMDQVEKTIEARVHQALEDKKLYDRFPDLEDSGSEFYKTAAKHYKRIEHDVKPGARVRVAAELAEAEMRREGTWQDPDAEASRRARIEAQNGSTGRGQSGGGDSEELTDKQKRMADEMGIAHDKLKARIKKGTNFSGKSALAMRLSQHQAGG